MAAYRRPFLDKLAERFGEKARFIQILVGPRQVGKTYAALQWVNNPGSKAVYVSADQLVPPSADWLREQWERARSSGARLLVVDEIQKVSRWSEAVKMLWEQDRQAGHALHVLLLGSSSLLMQRGLTESLAGRFELTRCGHWSWPECAELLGWNLEQWLRYGGYPGAAALVSDEPRWRAYIRDSMIETVLARDVLNAHIVTKPALLRQLFGLVCQAPARIVSYEKMVGQLTDAGNTTTLAHYLHVLAQSFLCGGLPKFSRGVTRSKASSPKLIVFNNALVTAMNPTQHPPPRGLPATERTERSAHWAAWRGRLVENAVGATLLSAAEAEGWTVTYWRERDLEVDFVVETPTELFAVEVKSGRPDRPAGLKAFLNRYPEAFPVVIGGDKLPVEYFFGSNPANLRVDFLRCGLSELLGAPVEVSRTSKMMNAKLSDFDMINFTNPANGKSGSYFARELDGARIFKQLKG
ncbi:MAG: ATP-binding protein [Verrucomicrobia bacterium]|nr:ATP-binding protein [Verrucomicrobiota bacterium]